MTENATPIACTLSHRDAEAQALEWVDLQGLALRTKPLASGARITFPSIYASRIVDLAQREAACCSFLDIVTSRDGDEFVVEITADDPDAIDVIALLTGLTPS